MGSFLEDSQPSSLVKIKGKTKFEVDKIGGSHMFIGVI